MKNLIAASVLALGVSVPSHAVAQAIDGGVVFKQRCMMCHSVTPGAKAALAPNLAGVSNRKAGSEAFAYSPALKNSKIVWNAETLDMFLRAPSKMVPGTRMIVNIPGDPQRTAVVAYMLTLKGK